ncbi:motility associated factor glycosyltransferase family protein [Lysinibacillus sp. 3P01SB]|uniref:motility associated factor glycosyltransferase family protein n=1 Tax=Lysinibacillus sp. 3P01SB TaxID=3132284 RepID=UPI0039A6FED4
MQFDVIKAIDGQKTLKVNDIFLYSKYKPIQDAERWIDKEFDDSADSYILIGLGLGYHLSYLATKTRKNIYVLYFDKNELAIAEENIPLYASHIHIVSHLSDLHINKKMQVLIHHAWVQIMKSNTKVYEILDTMKRNQISFKKFSGKMFLNASENLKNYIPNYYPEKQSKTACLVSSGPSLNETIHWLENNKDIEIFVVGSALKVLLSNGVIPDAVVLTDAQDSIKKQLEGTNYKGTLYYLLTASAEAVKSHLGPKYLLCQEGYTLAEEAADKFNLPKLTTGGSVATTAFSLIEYMGYENIVLFGQDLGFTGNDTHVIGSTSGKKVQTDFNVLANDGSYINTQPNLQVYLRWFNEQCINTKMNVYNTAVKGAQIQNVPLINKDEFEKLKA